METLELLFGNTCPTNLAAHMKLSNVA